jgi:hypothetical protein
MQHLLPVLRLPRAVCGQHKAVGRLLDCVAMVPAHHSTGSTVLFTSLLHKLLLEALRVR